MKAVLKMLYDNDITMTIGKTEDSDLMYVQFSKTTDNQVLQQTYPVNIEHATSYDVNVEGGLELWTLNFLRYLGQWKKEDIS